jgi:hypothetical protein
MGYRETPISVWFTRLRVAAEARAAACGTGAWVEQRLPSSQYPEAGILYIVKSWV